MGDDQQEKWWSLSAAAASHKVVVARMKVGVAAAMLPLAVLAFDRPRGAKQRIW